MSGYVREYLKKRCSSELQYLFCQSKNPVKEISESMAAFKHLYPFIDLKDVKHYYICIGDGSLCMTGALFAFVTNGWAVSIDPNINLAKVMDWKVSNRVRRLDVYKAKYQDVVPKGWDLSGYNYDLICVHAHVDLTDLVKKFPNWRYLYTNPCCHVDKQTFTIQYQDRNSIVCVRAGTDSQILSEKKDIFVYRNDKYVKVGGKKEMDELHIVAESEKISKIENSLGGYCESSTEAVLKRLEEGFMDSRLDAELKELKCYIPN